VDVFLSMRFNAKKPRLIVLADDSPLLLNAIRIPLRLPGPHPALRRATNFLTSKPENAAEPPA